ncbi:hypothetical protein [Consotaella salsifontis]|uniref:Uncharacterized protein n=1 Tax=Consotaella salsifontis TaxID=1365950 RepID=A0A1T4SJ21_9HYPH|nr:hypothetical protein [Consotaella salsifontis]SKA28290.1 hypothetical protein SAMN05428963_11165 [Consotaella salsifontis]
MALFPFSRQKAPRFRSQSRDASTDERRLSTMLAVLQTNLAEISQEYEGLRRRLQDLEPTSAYLAGNSAGEVDTSAECQAAVTRTETLFRQSRAMEDVIARLKENFA